MGWLTIAIEIRMLIHCTQYLEALGEDGFDEQKSEYSLTQHLANNLIDMYINLPSKNNYRRPASYASKGYHTRRMAVDFAVTLLKLRRCWLKHLFVRCFSMSHPSTPRHRTQRTRSPT